MQFAQQDIITLTEDIWLSTTGLPVRRVEDRTERLQGHTIDGIVNITGDWQGVVVLQCSRELASRVAGKMFQLDATQPALEDMLDALGELTNMTGGHIKALMPGDCALSLPVVVEGADYTVRLPGTKMVTRLTFECSGLLFVVSLLGNTTAGRVSETT